MDSSSASHDTNDDMFGYVVDTNTNTVDVNIDPADDDLDDD
jgi:hypothetical protein